MGPDNGLQKSHLSAVAFNIDSKASAPKARGVISHLIFADSPWVQQKWGLQGPNRHTLV